MMLGGAEPGGDEATSRYEVQAVGGRGRPGCDVTLRSTVTSAEVSGVSVEALAVALARHGGPWTEDEYLALPEVPGRVELLDGTLLVSPQAAGDHQRLARQIGYALDVAATAGYEVIEAINVRVRSGRILIPDIAVLTRPGLVETVYDASIVALVVEVTSPSNAGIDRITKPDAYARAGIPHYVRVDLDRGHDQLGAEAYALTPSGVYGEVARADERGRLRLDAPYRVTLELAAYVRATGYPRS